MQSASYEKLQSSLLQRHVFIKRPAEVKEKIAALISDGPSCLQVITDFDKTITKYRHMNKRVPSSFHIIESHSLIPEDIKNELETMQKKYYAIELDHTMTIEEKTPHMIAWNTVSGELLVKAGVKKLHLTEMVKDSNVSVRDGFTEFSKSLCDKSIPMLVFSAGVGDVAEEVLRQKAAVLPNMKIIANFMNFDKNEVLTGFKGKLIHTFNKNGKYLEEEDVCTGHANGRRNVILMGDMAGDLTMAEGVSGLQNCLRLGF